jgi:hypothetical protein
MSEDAKNWVVCGGKIFCSRASARQFFDAKEYSACMALYMEPYNEKKHASLLKRQTKSALQVASPKTAKSKKLAGGEKAASANWLKIRAEILKADVWQCRICAAQDDLHVHHINKNRKDNRAHNLVTLCSSCHRGVHATNYIAGSDGYDDGSAWGFLKHRENAL